jgi:carboxypeptidase C (cathepsin A)
MTRFSVFTILFFSLILTAQELKLETNKKVVTSNQVTINGQLINYQATTGTQPVWDDSGKEIAFLHYTYYQRKDIKKIEERPLLISFNGGPGSASVWMHLAYTGPRILKIDDEGYPVQPYGFKDNPHSVLDVADILYVNPVNTGYSRTIPFEGKDVDRSKFFGINADIKYLAGWINTFISRNDRWLSPKYLIGESYGGTRVSGLALELQNRQWMYLNGVVLVSPADYKVIREEGPVSEALNIPYYTATAWYHKRLPEALQNLDLMAVLAQSETFAIDEVLPALTRGGFLEPSKRLAMAEKMAYFTGLKAKDF